MALTYNDTQEKLEFEKLKLIYEKTAEHHKYFLTWRQLLLAGYFAIMGIMFYSIYTLANTGRVLPSLTANGIGILIYYLSDYFFRLEERNKELYQICQNVCKNIEQKMLNFESNSIDEKALFQLLTTSSKNTKHSHSETIERIYRSIGVLGLISIALVTINYFIVLLDRYC